MKKRFLTLSLAAMLLCCLFVGCLPTPEQEFVVNKGDNTLEQKLDATGEPGAQNDAVLLFPERWEEAETEVYKGVFLSVKAEIIQKTDGRCPVYRTKTAQFTTQDVIEKLNLLLGKTAATYEFQYTKEYWKNMLKMYLEWVEERRQWLIDGVPDLGDYDYWIPDDDDPYVQMHISQMMSFIQDAPDELESRPVSDFSGLEMKKRTCYKLESGATAMVLCKPSYWYAQRKNDGGEVFRVLRSYEYEAAKENGEPIANAWVEPKMTRADAETILNRELERLGYTDYVLNAAFPANYIRQNEQMSFAEFSYFTVSPGWAFRLRRNYGNYSVYNAQMLPSQFLQYENADAAVYNESIPDETIDVFIDADGLQSISCSAPKEIVGIANPNIELLPFDEIKERIKKTLGACLVGKADDLGNHFEIYRLLLTTYTIREKDGSGYLEMPCWYVFFDWPLDEEGAREARRADLSGEWQQSSIAASDKVKKRFFMTSLLNTRNSD